MTEPLIVKEKGRGLFKGRLFLVEGTSGKHTQVGTCLACVRSSEEDRVAEVQYIGLSIEYLEFREEVGVEGKLWGVICLCMVLTAMGLDVFPQRLRAGREEKRSED